MMLAERSWWGTQARISSTYKKQIAAILTLYNSVSRNISCIHYNDAGNGNGSYGNWKRNLQVIVGGLKAIDQVINSERTNETNRLQYRYL